MRIGGRYVASAGRIAIALSQLGYEVGATLVREHRSKLCACYRKVADNG